MVYAIDPLALAETGAAEPFDDLRHAAATLGFLGYEGTPGRMALARPRDGRIAVEELPVWAVPLRGALPALLTLPLRREGVPAWRRAPASAVVWALAARLAVRLVSAHRLTPTLTSIGDGQISGVWRAVVSDDPEVCGLLARLANAMPRAGHALSRGDGRVWDPATLLGALLDAVADLAVRDGGPPPSAGRPRARLLPWTARWAEALADPVDPLVPVREDAAELAASVGGWHAGANEDGGVGATELRLTAPDSHDGVWRLDFGVRTPGGELRPAAKVWAAKREDSESALLQETLLRGLGRCARVFAPIDRLLSEPAPEYLNLSLSEAWELLRDAAPMLPAIGVAVRLPGDLVQEQLRPRLRVGAQAREATADPKTAGTVLDDDFDPFAGNGLKARPGGLTGLLVGFRWEIAIGDETLTAEEFEAIVATKQPLVRWRDRWVRVDPGAVERIGKLGDTGEVSLAEALALGLGGDVAAGWSGVPQRRHDSSADDFTEGDAEAVEVVADGAVALLLDRIRAAADQPPAPSTPAGFEGELRGYQRRGVAWLGGMGELGLGAVLADDMGLGKCVAPDTLILSNGKLVPASDIWQRYAREPVSDGLGEWADPTSGLVTGALGSGQRIVPARIRHLYRQFVREPVRRIVLEDGNAVTLTRQHKLLGTQGWTNQVQAGDRVAVPKRVGGDSPEVSWGRVAGIDLLDYEGWVYDFEVAEHHNFVTRGLLCHNTIQLIAHLLERPREDGPHLIVCPTSVVGNWEREIQRFAPLMRIVRHHGADRPRDLRQLAGAVLTTYGTLRRDADFLAGVEWDVIALDEAQYVKNPTTAAARAVRGLRARQVVALTGTPLENRLSELWSILDATNPGLLGTPTSFGRRFVAPIEKQRDGAAAARLRRLISPFVLRRSKSDPHVIADLPAKIERTVVCPLTPEQAALYQAAVDRAMATLANAKTMERRGRILALLTELKQICNHPAQYLNEALPRLPGRAGKLAAAQEVVAEATNAGDRVLVFTQFVTMGRLLATQLSRDLDVEVPFLHGAVAAGGRDRMVERFQSDPDASPVLIVSLRAGGTGLNLTAATHVIHYDRWWNPAVEDQATDRAHRIGQTRTVEVHKLVTAGTLEERIAEMLERKRALADAVVGVGEAWVTELDDDALAELVALSRDAELMDLTDDEDEESVVSAWSG